MQSMKFAQIVEYNERDILFFKNHAENDAGRLYTDLFLFLKTVLYKVKANGQHFSFNTFW